jgi:Flp pilus assembly protein TadG
MAFKEELIRHQSLASQQGDGMARNLIRTQKGVAVVELAIVILILLVVLFGIGELSIALYDKAVLTNASREGARAGIVAQDPRVSDAEIKGVVENYATKYLITFGSDVLGDENITIARTGTGKDFGDDLTVSVKYRYDFLVLSRLVSTLVGPITLNATTVMKLE